jgi:hypothetical protein
MGRFSAYLPTESEWHSRAPEWSVPLWSILKSELEDWCLKNKAQLYIDASASVYPA